MINERYESYVRRMETLARILRFIKKHYLKIVIPVVAATVLTLALLAVTGIFVQDISCGDCVYGEMPPCSAKALFSDVTYEFCTADGEWTGDVPTTVGAYRVRAVSVDGFGRNRYSSEASFTISEASLTMKVKDTTGVYGDTDAFRESNVEVTGLVAGDRIEGMRFSSEDISEGKIRIGIHDFSVINEQGDNVTDSYRVQLESGVFSYQPRRVVFASENMSKTYDAIPVEAVHTYLQIGSLAEGDCAEYSCTLSVVEAGDYQALFSVKIVDGNGKDVSHRYLIEYQFGTVSIARRAVSIQTAGGEKVYDGAPLKDHTWKLTDGEQIAGHMLNVEVNGSQTDAGQSENSATVTVLDGNGRDVTHNYDVQVNAGVLKVIPRPITVKTGSATKIYDGTPLTHAEYSCEGDLVAGHSLQVRTTGSRTVVGISDNTFEATVYDKGGNDVTANYDITPEPGKLEITPHILRYQTGSAEKVYDGTPLTKKEWTKLSGSLLPGHYATVTVTGSQTNAGVGKNTLRVTVHDQSGRDVTAEGYAIETELGSLTVKPRPITVRSIGKEKLYDGTPLYYHAWTHNSNDLVSDHGLNPTFTGSQTKVGSSANTFTVKIQTSDKLDVTANYDITYQYGTLTVLPNPDYSDEYAIGERDDDQDNELFATIRADAGGAVYLRQTSYGDYTGSTWLKAIPYEKNIDSACPLFFTGESIYSSLVQKNFKQIEITLEKNCPYLAPYYTTDSFCTSINFDDLSYFFKARHYYVRTDNTKEYEDLVKLSIPPAKAEAENSYRNFVKQTYLQIPESTKQSLLSIARENGISANSKTLVTDIQDYIRHAAVYDLNVGAFPEGEDVAVYFLTTAKRGFCQHFACAATMMYRAFGIPARYTVGFLAQTEAGVETEVYGKNAHAWVEIYVDGVGWVMMEVTASAEGPSVGGGGSGTPPEGLLLTVSGMTAEKVYDGKPFEDSYYRGIWVSGGSLLEGHTLTATVSSYSSYLPGTYETKVSDISIVDKDGNSVKDMYRIFVQNGSLTINKRPITIRSTDATKVYDGTTLIDDSWWISEGSLAPDETIKVRITGAQTEVGSSPNSIIVNTINRADGSYSQSCYDITVKSGTLTVKKE